MIGFAESEDIGPLPPIAQFARYVLFVKAIGPHAEAGAMPVSGHPGFGEIEIPACAGMTRRPAAIQSESAFPQDELALRPDAPRREISRRLRRARRQSTM